MSIRVTRTVVLLTLIIASACRIERTPRIDAADPANVARAEIELTLRNYQQALLEGDARAAAAVFTPAAHLYLPDTPDIVGRGAIDEALASRFAGDSIIEMVMEYDLIEVNAGVAHQFGRFHQRVRAAGADADRVTDEATDREAESSFDSDAETNSESERDVEGRFAIRWIRAADSTWSIERLLLNHSPADSAAQAQPRPDSEGDSQGTAPL